MGDTEEALKSWLDADFYKRGAFLTSTDGDVIFTKGGTFTVTDGFTPSSSPVFYLKDFFTNSYLSYTPDKFIKLKKGSVLHLLKDESDAHPPISPVQNDDDLYQKDFQFLRSSFNQGLEKVVLISRETYEGFHAEKTIRRLLRRAFEFDAGWPYGFWHDSYGMIGSTPELLYEVRHKTLSTFALAGTARKGEEEKLLSSKKDRHEHDLVVKDIKEKLAPFVSDLAVYETEILPFKTMVHLKTDIVGKVREGIDYSKLTGKMSPTAALGGYPMEMSLRFLKGSHYAGKHPTRYFGSAFGVISDEMKQFIVAIRNVQWEEGQLFIECGGGVVPESDFHKELEEVHLKRETIRKNYL